MKMFILEGSDSLFTFHITEHSKSGDITDVDLTVYDKILLEVRYTTGVIEYEGSLDNEENTEKNSTSYVSFEIVGEATKGKAGPVRCDIWGVKDEQKVRFNWDTIQGEVLSSVKVPEWIVNG